MLAMKFREYYAEHEIVGEFYYATERVVHGHVGFRIKGIFVETITTSVDFQNFIYDFSKRIVKAGYARNLFRRNWQ